jgi:hypothetical protein
MVDGVKGVFLRVEIEDHVHDHVLPALVVQESRVLFIYACN